MTTQKSGTTGGTRHSTSNGSKRVSSGSHVASSAKAPARSNNNLQRYAIVAALVAASFFGAYKFAEAQNRTVQQIPASGGTVQAVAPGGGTSGVTGTTGTGGTGGGGCCGGGAAQTPVAGKTTVSGDVQKVTIDLTGGTYSPNQITAKAGVPIELDFKGPAPSCNGYVVSQQLGFQQDVSNGGTIKVPAQQPGTYTFTCSMGMYAAQIIVK